MTKRKFRLKPFIIAAVIAAISAASLITVNAATNGGIVKFFMGGEEIEVEYYDYVDEDGFRCISFGAVLPRDADKYAAIYDVDAPQGENLRVLTPETDPEFFEKLGPYGVAQYKAIDKGKAMWDKIQAWKGDFDRSDSLLREALLQEAIQAGIVDPSEVPEDFEPEDYGLVFKDSELCLWRYNYFDKETNRFYDCEGELGGEFKQGKSAKISDELDRTDEDLENGTKTIKYKLCYYVGNEE